MSRSHKTVLLALCFLAVEIVLIAAVDRPLSMSLRALEQHHPSLTDFFRAYTDFGKSQWYLWPAGAGLLFCAGVLRLPSLAAETRARLAATGHQLVFLFACVAGSGLITDLIKRVIGRARPVMLAREHIYGFRPFSFDAAWQSMPSGHTTTAAALMAVLTLLFPRGKAAWVLLWGALAASRCMVNAHYVSDVVAGTAIGVLFTLWVAHYRDKQGMFPFFTGIFPIDKRHKFP